MLGTLGAIADEPVAARDDVTDAATAALGVRQRVGLARTARSTTRRRPTAQDSHRATANPLARVHHKNVSPHTQTGTMTTRTDGFMWSETLQDARKRVGQTADLRDELIEARDYGVTAVDIGWILDRLSQIVDIPESENAS